MGPCEGNGCYGSLCVVSFALTSLCTLVRPLPPVAAAIGLRAQYRFLLEDEKIAVACTPTLGFVDELSV
jgi:hypothetical protein